jgi:hypothetical protein
MKITEVIQKQPVTEDASTGGTASGAVATSMPGGGAGFGTSIFMKRNPGPIKKKRKQ